MRKMVDMGTFFSQGITNLVLKFFIMYTYYAPSWKIMMEAQYSDGACHLGTLK
jgi:hypothetical protein